MACNLCGEKEYKRREGEVRDNKELEIYECISCGLVYLSDTSHIKKDFYEESNMHKEFDYEKWKKETAFDDQRRFDFLKSSLVNKRVLDFGSGNGGFVFKAKNLAKEVEAVELEKAIHPYYEQNSIPLYDDLAKIDKKYDLITSFHVIEHLENPEEILIELKKLLLEKGRMIIEVPNANDALLTIYENEGFSKFTYWSCHLYLYTQYTLTKLAKKAGLKVDFIKHIQRYPLSNHLYWLSKNKPGGHDKWGNFIDSDDLSKAYESQLAKLNATDTIIAQFSKE